MEHVLDSVADSVRDTLSDWLEMKGSDGKVQDREEVSVARCLEERRTRGETKLRELEEARRKEQERLAKLREGAESSVAAATAGRAESGGDRDASLTATVATIVTSTDPVLGTLVQEYGGDPAKFSHPNSEAASAKKVPSEATGVGAVSNYVEIVPACNSCLDVVGTELDIGFRAQRRVCVLV